MLEVMGTAEENNDNAPVAFALVTAAGLSTCIGAAFVFHTRLVRVRPISTYAWELHAQID